jgi:glycogen operon protein
MSPRGERVVDDTFYVLLNAHYEALSFTLPGREWDWRWVKALDTNAPLPAESDQIVEAGKEILVEAQSLVVLRQEE